MKPSTTPNVPPALRKPVKAADISSAFPPILPKAKPAPIENQSPSSPPETPLSTGSDSPAPAPAAAVPTSSASDAPPSSLPNPALTSIPPAKPSKPSPSEPGPSKPEAPDPLPVPSKPSDPKPLPPGKPSQPRPLPPVKPSQIASRPSIPASTPKGSGDSSNFRPRVAAIEGHDVLFEGTFRPAGHDSFTCETKLTGNGKADRQTIINLARKKYPTGQMSLVSTRIITRSSGSPASFKRGTTLGQLFGEAGTPTEVSVEIGTVFFDGTRCQIFLRNLRSRNCVTFSLRQPKGGTVNFSNQIQANRPATDLLLVAREVFGTNVRELNITLKEEAK